MIHVLLVDDHPAVRAGYARFLEQEGGITVVAEAACADTGYSAYLQHTPDVTISDISMPHVGGMELLRKIKQRNADAKVLMCSMYDGRNLVRSALEGGAMGFVTKNSPPENLVTGVKSAYCGQRYLSDDLSFSHDDQHYKSLKAVLDGGIEGRPENVLFYATSNRRHLMPRDMIENERATAITPGEAVEEKVSLSDRFGLWLGFHPCDQDQYLDMIRGYCAAHGVRIGEDRLRAEAIEWQATRGSRSGRVAWQFFCDLAAREGVRI